MYVDARDLQKKVTDSAGKETTLTTAQYKAQLQARGLEKLVEAVLSGQVKYCPHGRPVSIALSRKDLDKQFKRIV